MIWQFVIMFSYVFYENRIPKIYHYEDRFGHMIHTKFLRGKFFCFLIGDKLVYLKAGMVYVL